MNQRFTLTLAALVSLFVMSCKKESTTTNNNNSGKLKTYTEEYSSPVRNFADTSNVTYDASGRMATLENPKGKLVYTYGNGSITADIYDSTGLTIHEVSFLNAQQLIDSTVQVSGTDTSTEKYFYNAANQLVQLRSYDNGGSGLRLSDIDSYTYDSNGNLVTETNQSGNGMLKATTTRTFTNIAAQFPLMAPFTSAQYKNFPASANIVTTSDTINETYTYQFDSNNRLVTETTVTTTGGQSSTLVKRYTYY